MVFNVVGGDVGGAISMECGVREGGSDEEAMGCGRVWDETAGSALTLALLVLLLSSSSEIDEIDSSSRSSASVLRLLVLLMSPGWTEGRKGALVLRLLLAFLSDGISWLNYVMWPTSMA